MAGQTRKKTRVGGCPRDIQRVFTLFSSDDDDDDNDDEVNAHHEVLEPGALTGYTN